MIIVLQGVRDSSDPPQNRRIKMLKDYVISFTVDGYTVHG